MIYVDPVLPLYDRKEEVITQLQAEILILKKEVQALKKTMAELNKLDIIKSARRNV